MRHSLVLVAAAAAAMTALPAQATPTAGVQRYLTTSFSVVGADGNRYAFDLTASEPGAGTGFRRELVLDLTLCSAGGQCRPLSRVRVPLVEQAVVVAPDLTRGTLDVALAGVPVSVRLTQSYVTTAPLSVGGLGVGIYSLESAGAGPSPRFSVYNEAIGTARVGSATCSTGGRLASYQGLDRTGDDVRDPRPTALRLPQTVVTALAHPRCAG